MSNFKFIIPRLDDQKFKTYTEPSLKKIGVQALQVFDKPGIKENIFKKYNAGIEALFQGGIQDDDIVVFCHEDVSILDNLFKEKVQLLFQEKTDVGLIGIAGATELTDRGGWWMNTPLTIDKDGNQKGSLVGHLIQGKDDKNKGEGFHLQKGAIGYFDNVVAIDGCIMITQGRFLKEGIKFDDINFKYNDFYDIDFGFQFLERGYKIAVADILIFHQSTGMGSLQEPWKESKEILIKKWTNNGYKFPITIDQFKIKKQEDQIVEIEI